MATAIATAMTSIPLRNNKPVYRVPSMNEIRAIPWNGLRVVSTFSGCGGSCLGYRMAGYRVAWANEFVPAAQDSYRANMAEGSILDGRDIHAIQPEEILAAVNLATGEIDLFDGSPPCQAFSTAGKRADGWGTLRKYENGAAQCNETLFDEYIRLLRGLRPKVFVAENVSGLVKGVAKGWFLDILTKLKACGYRVQAKLLDAQWLGVPQMRQRIIFVGIREDLGIAPVFPKPLRYRYSVRDALPWLSGITQELSFVDEHIRRTKANQMFPTVKAAGLGAAVRSRIRIHGDTWGDIANHSSPVIVGSDAKRSQTARFSGGGWIEEQSEKRKFTITELKRICAFPDDFILTGSYAQQWERLGNAVPPLMMKAIAETICDEVLSKVDK